MTQAEDHVSRVVSALKLLARNRGVQRDNILDLLDGELQILRDLWSIRTQKGKEDAARRTIYASIVSILEQIDPPARNPRDRELSVEQRARQFKRNILVVLNTGSIGGLEKEGQGRRYAWLNSPKNDELRANEAAVRRDFDYAVERIAQHLLGAQTTADALWQAPKPETNPAAQPGPPQFPATPPQVRPAPAPAKPTPGPMPRSVS